MQPRGRPLTLTDDDLLDAAREVFLSRGLDATTADIARRARISQSVIFHRYKTKEALFLAVVERQLVVPPAVARLVKLAGRGEVADNLFDAGMGLVELTHDALPFMMMACSSDRMNVFTRHAQTQHPLRRELIAILTRYFESEERKGRIRKVSGEILARTFFGGIIHYVMSEHLERSADPLGVSAFLRGLIDILLRGSLVQGPAPGRR
jgi:AcrR family transcriptional regulator